ncbi:MAG: mechanosensitive ion channel family protein [Porticoccaceae bacterium]|nr:mechanosensitive ion channel family protein [Pseudomonadales bacterium]MCP5171542.1 mechanosensitive ion channel family protein [Pseudomonadales bacterium]
MLDRFENWLIEIAGDRYVWVIEIFLIIFSALLLGYLINKLIDHLEVRAARTPNVWDDALIEAFRQPAIWTIRILGINIAVSIAARVAQSEWFDVIETVNRVAVIALVALFLVNLIKRAERNLILPEYSRDPMDPTTVSAIGKLLRISVVLSAALVAMQIMGYSISGVLAFGGVGGLAVGFAAKDLLANFFGGLMIYLDRPFKVGDWVRSPDKEIEGTVEDIGWRLTRIRTFDKRPLYVPNSVFTSISLENPSRMLNRRIKETLGIRYSDISHMKAIVNQVKQMLREHPDIDQEQTLIVNFNAFSASSVDFFIYTFTKTTEWIRYHEIKQDVLLKVADIIEQQGAEIAFPTRTLHIADSAQVAEAGEG